MLNKLKFLLITALPSLLFFFFLIPNADAASVYTIYAYGSGYIMVGILQSVASVVASGGFSLILKSVVLIGFVIIFLQMIITSFKVSPHRSLVKYFSAVLVIYSALLIPKVNVNVYDTVNNTGSGAVVVNNVPWGIGAIASYFSQFQYYMTTSIEQAFSTPNTIDLTNAGMGFALTSQNIVTGVQIDDPYLFQSFTQYVYNCVLPGISTGNLSSQALTQAGMSTTGTGNSTNSLLGYMASYTSITGANLLTTEYSAAGGDGSPSGTTTTCGAQTADIQNDFNTYATNEAGPQIAGALGMTYATFASNYGLVNNSIYSMSSNAMDEIIQMMAVNQYNQAMIQSANLAGVNPSQLAYGSALAQQNMTDSFSISGQMAGKYMPVIYGIFSALFLAFSLFLIILMALPIGVNYLKMYMELGLFLAVWPALMAVYNYIIDLIVQQQFTYLATQGYSLNSAHTINTFIATQLGWMGYLSWGVPMMAYALVTGSTYAMVGAISSMDAAGKSAASAGASAASSGNVNLGNDSMNNFNANKLNAVNDVSTGMKRNYYDSRSSNTGTADKNGPLSWESSSGGNESLLSDSASGNKVGMEGNKLSLALDPNLNGNITQAVTAGRQEAYSNAKSNERTMGQTWNSTMSHGAQFMNQFGSSLDAGEQKQFAADNRMSFMEAVNGDKSLSASQRQELIAKFSAKAGVAAGGFGAGFDAIQQSSLSAEQKASLTNKYSHDLGRTVSNSGSEGYSNKSVNGATLSDTLGATETASTNYSESAKQVKSLSDSISKSKNVSGTVAKNAVLGYLDHYNEEHGYTTANGYSQKQIETLDDAELNKLNRNSAPLERYVANNPDILKAENAVPNEKDIKSVPKKSQALGKIHQNYNAHRGAVNSNNPYIYNNGKSPQEVKKKVKELQKKSSVYIPAHKTVKNTPYNKLTPKQQLAYQENKAHKGPAKASNLVPDLIKAVTLGTYDDLTGNFKGAGKLGKKFINDLPKLNLNKKPIVPISTYHPGKLKILNPKAYKLQQKEYARLTGDSPTGFQKIAQSNNGIDATGLIKKGIAQTNNKLHKEAPLPVGNNGIPPDTTK